MTDEKKFKVTLVLSCVLILLILSYNILQESIIPEISGYVKRRIYFEKVISEKGLPLHEGKYWRKAE